MPVGINKNLNVVAQASPTRTSPRKASQSQSQSKRNSDPTTSASSSSSSINKLFPTPLSMSPSTASTISISTSSFTSLNGNANSNIIGGGVLRFPPSFDPNHPSSSSRYNHSNSNYTPYSPYRPGEYGRSERGLASASERTKIERKLFDDDEEENANNNEILEEPLRKKDDNKLLTVDNNVNTSNNSKKEGSSPLAPAFQAKMVLRNGASIDLISWLRTNFHHVSPPHTVLTPCMPLNGIRHLLLERFPRAPEVEEISKAVLAAFPHSQWDYPTGTSSEPPNIRGLVWHGKDINDEDEIEEPIKSTLKSSINLSKTSTSNKISTSLNNKQNSRSPTQSTLVSPISSSKRQLPDTPARSVLEEFAEIATLADKTPTLKAKSLPDDEMLVDNEYQLDQVIDDLNRGFSGRTGSSNRKRHASQSPELGISHRRRASTPDKLHGLLAAAEAVEGSPITSVLNHERGNTHGHGHKRRRTIGGFGSAREIMSNNFQQQRQHNQQRKSKQNRLSRGTLSPPIRNTFNFLPQLKEKEDGDGDNIDFLVPLNDTSLGGSHEEPSLGYDEEDAISGVIPLSRKAPNSSSTSQSSIISRDLPSMPSTSTSTGSGSGSGPGRKVNELPTEGEAPGYDCKPPYPYHEMIRHAIENAPDCRLQLSQIYSTIADRFPFFKTLDEKKTAGWQNSIRHNLSLKKMFVRVNKPDGIPDDSGGKGGWWTVQPGVPDEGRPGRKAKAKKAKADAENGNATINGGEGEAEGDESFEGFETNQNQNQDIYKNVSENGVGNGDITKDRIIFEENNHDAINGMIGLQYPYQQQQQQQQNYQEIYSLPLPQRQGDQLNANKDESLYTMDMKSKEKSFQPSGNNDQNTQVSIHEIPLSQGI